MFKRILVALDGSESSKRAANVAVDIADCIVYAVTRPPHVDIDEIVVRPVAQAATWLVARKP